MMINIVFVIPVFQHGDELKRTILAVSEFNLPIIVVNDGSDALQSQKINEVCNSENIILVERSENGGKGAAVIDGVRTAEGNGFSHAFQIDADGQHDLSSVPEFVGAAKNNPGAIILGYPFFDQSIPIGRKAGRWLTHIWVWINTLSFAVRDAMCGFRIYPVAPIIEIAEKSNIGSHMEFDPELCVRACWRGLEIINLPVSVTYPKDGKSNFRLKEDNILISMMHTRLFFGMLIRSPKLIFTRIRSIFRHFRSGRDSG